MQIAVLMNSIDTPKPTHVITELRELLEKQFPEAQRRGYGMRETQEMGIPALDTIGLPASGLVELINGKRGNGLSLLLWGILRSWTLEAEKMVAVIDAADRLEVTDWPPAMTTRLLWVRCQSVKEAVRAADLLAQDGNICQTLIDFRGVAERAFRKLPQSLWYRLRHAADENGICLLLCPPTGRISCAHVRIEVTSYHGLDTLTRDRLTLLENLSLQVERSRPSALPESRRLAG